MKITEKDLVMLRLNNNPDYLGRQKHYNTWFRVMFVDTDGTFIGRVERIDKYEFTLYQIDQDIRLDTERILTKYETEQQWCYSDGITICKCMALCRNK